MGMFNVFQNLTSGMASNLTHGMASKRSSNEFVHCKLVFESYTCASKANHLLSLIEFISEPLDFKHKHNHL